MEISKREIENWLCLMRCWLLLSAYYQIHNYCCPWVTAFAQTCWYNAYVVGQDYFDWGAGGRKYCVYCRQCIGGSNRWNTATDKVLRTVANELNVTYCRSTAADKVLRTAAEISDVVNYFRCEKHNGIRICRPRAR